MKLNKYLVILFCMFCVLGCAKSSMISEIFIGDLKIVLIKQGRNFYSKQYYMNELISSQKITSWMLGRKIEDVHLVTLDKRSEDIIEVIYKLQNYSEDLYVYITLNLTAQGKIISVYDPHDPAYW